MLARSSLTHTHQLNIPKLSVKLPTLKISHIGPHVRVQGIDNHLPVRWTRDLHTTVLKTRRWRRTFPRIVLTNVLGLWEEVWEVALVELRLADHTSLEQLLSSGVESSVQHGEEDDSVLVQDLLLLVIDVSEDVDILEDGLGIWRANHDV